MLEYSKLILQKISFNNHLFCKELKKFLQWLNIDDKLVLISWCKKNYPEAFENQAIQINQEEFTK